MPEATLSVLNRLGKKLVALDDSEGFINNICRDDAWELVKAIGFGEVSGSEAKALFAEIRARVAHFEGDVLSRVRGLGGQFASARLTTVPGGETLESQRDHRVIKFWTDWHFKSMKPEETLVVSPSIGSEVVYLPNLIENSLGCTYDKVDGKQSVQDILDSLPKVKGLRWIIGNTPTVNRVLANHLQETDGKEYLLYSSYTWTSDTYESPEYGLRRLVAGDFDSDGVYVNFLWPFYSHDNVGVFALGVPA